LKPALTGRDIGALFRWVNAAGVVQRQIAVLTGSSQSEVADIMTGRRGRVMAYDVIERTAEGLTVPRERMGLSYWGPDGHYYGPEDAYPGGVTVAELEGVADVLRRHVLGLGGVTIVGATVEGLGELFAELPDLSPVPLPDRLSGVHVAKVRDLTQQIREVGRAYGSDPAVSSAAAKEAMRLLRVSGPEPVKRELKSAVAGLHLEAGWDAFDAGLYDRAMYHYARALELAIEAGDAYLQVVALNRAGLASVEHGHPDDGLKMLQIGQVKAWDIPSTLDRSLVVIGGGSRVALQACGMADSATALVMLGQPDAAYREQGKARELWTPARDDPEGDLDRPAALLELTRGRLDVAEPLAAASVHRWEGISQRGRTRSRIVLATIHVKAGERSAPGLAYDAITAVGKLTSVRARRQLVPLAEALESRRGSDYAELARTARQVATTRV
ncbi:MAG: hypothetical protein ACRDSN_06855, partial [Pseudonocardiaceae bacterium]